MPHDHHAIIALASKDGGKPLGVFEHLARSMALSLVVGAVVTGTASTAAGSTTFPPIVKSRWNISQFAGASGDGCTLCHKDNNGGYGTATRPFGKTMLRLRVVGKSPDTLPRALDSDKNQALDSDGDSIPDYQELAVDHTNPNDPKSFKLPPEPMNGGAGGQLNEPGSTSEGGQSSSEQLPPTSQPPPDDLPPPFEHGCAMAIRATNGGAGTLLVLAGFVAALRRRSSRTKTGR